MRERKSRMWTLLVAVLVVLGLGAFVGYRATQAVPAQPIAFNHQAHVDVGVQCLYCHSNALRGQSAGLPTISKCMGCHQQMEPKTDGEKQLAEYAASGKPVKWVPVAIQPDFVYFSHRVHLAGGVNCETCHGEVGKMTVARPVVTQNMGWCLSCHKNLDPEHFVKLSDCATCHK